VFNDKWGFDETFLGGREGVVDGTFFLKVCLTSLSKRYYGWWSVKYHGFNNE
jgi:hypothetical protein